MAKFKSPLDHVSVAAPCPADWEQMIGTDRVRFCGQCNLNVYNLSSMSRAEAEAFISNNEGRLCVRYYRRRDGSILTRNCPVGLRAIRRRFSRVAQAVGTAVLSFFAGLGFHSFTRTESIPREHRMGTIAFQPAPMGRPVMGDMYVEKPPMEIRGQMVMLPQPSQPATSRRK